MTRKCLIKLNLKKKSNFFAKSETVYVTTLMLLPLNLLTFLKKKKFISIHELQN